MLSSTTKQKIDNARDILVGKIPTPTGQVEHITLALMYKFMHDMDELSKSLGGKAKFFAGDYRQYAWKRIMDPGMSAHERVNLYSQGLEKMSRNSALPQLFRDIFKRAFLPFRDAEVLTLFLKQIDEFRYDHSEELGNAFEYLLSIMGTQGEAGQFRTPRHIIDFIVKAVDPKKTDRILDPACGTAGFLIAAFKHIMAENTKDISGKASSTLTQSEKNKLPKNFVGYDISYDMVRLSLVNLYLHKFPNPTIEEYDTLTSTDRWDDDFDCILANPPFMTPKGGIRPHNRFSIKSKRSELLFADYIVEHMRPEGNAGFIIPEGIMFVEDNAYVKFRRRLVENNYLYAVVSLPHGIFKPYASVKTHVLLLDRRLASRSDSILFIDIEADGFTQTDTRLPVDQNDIPIAEAIIEQYRKTLSLKLDVSRKTRTPEAYLVTKQSILKRSSCPLIGRWYNLESKYPRKPSVSFKELGVLCDFNPGLSPNMKTLPGDYVLVTPAEDRKTSDHYDYEGPAVCVPLVSSSGHGKADIKRLHYQDGKFALATTMLSLTPKRDSGITARYLYQILSEKKDVLLVPLMAGATNVTLKQDLLQNIFIPVPSPTVQREIVDHAAWEALATNASDLREQIAQGIDGEKAEEIDGLLAQVTKLLHQHAVNKRYISDIWPEE